MGQISKVVSFSEMKSRTKKKWFLITNVQLLMTLEKFNFFKNFSYLLIGGHGEKLKKIAKLGRSAFSKGSINMFKVNVMYTRQHLFPPEIFPRMLRETKIWNFVTVMEFTV